MRKLADLIAAASIAMLTTEEADGSMRSRPLATA
jgi:general stress protein 26